MEDQDKNKEIITEIDERLKNVEGKFAPIPYFGSGAPMPDNVEDGFLKILMRIRDLEDRVRRLEKERIRGKVYK